MSREDPLRHVPNAGGPNYHIRGREEGKKMQKGTIAEGQRRTVNWRLPSKGRWGTFHRKDKKFGGGAKCSSENELGSEKKKEKKVSNRGTLGEVRGSLEILATNGGTSDLEGKYYRDWHSQKEKKGTIGFVHHEPEKSHRGRRGTRKEYNMPEVRRKRAAQGRHRRTADLERTRKIGRKDESKSLPWIQKKKKVLGSHVNPGGSRWADFPKHVGSTTQL